MRAIARRVIVFCAGALLAAAAGETGLRLFCLMRPCSACFPDAGVRMEISDPVLGFRGNPAFPGHDADGFRNPSTVGQADIVVLGDSQSYGVGAALSESWPQQLAGLAGCRVYSMAFGGYSPVQALQLLEKAIRLKPRIVVATVYSGNDLAEAYWSVYDEGRLPQLESDDPFVREAVRQADMRGKLRAVAAAVFRRGTPEERRMRPLPRFLLRHTRLYAFARQCKWNIQAALSPGRGLWEHEMSVVRRHPDYFQAFSQGRLRTVFASRARLLALDQDDPRISEGLRICLASIDAMRQRCAEERIVLAVAGIPTKEFVFRHRVAAAGAAAGPACPGSSPQGRQAYARLLEQEDLVWQRVADSLARMRVVFIPCEPALVACLKESRQPYPQARDGHPNVVGYRAIALAVRRALSGSLDAAFRP